jgi:hypothetical protein
MKKTLRNTMIATWIGIVGVGRLAKADGANTKPRLAVCVRNYAQIPAPIMRKAEEVARDIFKRAGVETTWINAAISAYSAQTAGPSCASSDPLVHVQIINEEMAKALHLPSNVLGLAPGDAEEHDRTMVFVFDAVANQLLREQGIAKKSDILGHAMAHEIGHILTHMEKHSHAGIMKANWKEADFRAMMIGNLSFEPDQVVRIQAEVSRRTRNATTRASL